MVLLCQRLGYGWYRGQSCYVLRVWHASHPGACVQEMRKKRLEANKRAGVDVNVDKLSHGPRYSVRDSVFAQCCAFGCLSGANAFVTQLLSD